MPALPATLQLCLKLNPHRPDAIVRLADDAPELALGDESF